MRSILPAIVYVIAFTTLVSSCNKGETGPHVLAPVFSTYIPATPADTSNIREIYYGLLTPVEVCNIFDRLGLSFNDTIILPSDNCNLYMSSYKAAMNLGVYGVDMGYMKLFGINRQTVSYFNTIKTLSERLDMPVSFLSDAVKEVDQSMNNADSLTGLMNNAYKKIDDHLRSEGSQGTMGLMMMGGWVEAMFIATQLAYDPKKPDPQVVEKIAEQKYSLLSLMSFMKNYYDDPMVVFYTKKLKYLNRWFDTFDIYYREGDVKIDTTRQVITTTGSEMTVTVETLNQIRDYISRLRNEITAI
ncbi:MAG TPA: hypothetical protein VMV74_10950 [Bacteroidales bacterium]|nr:hypothetical protein [Bacteroidales bacterium]